MNEVGALLRREGRYADRGAAIPWLRLTLLLCLGGFAFGAVMGSSTLRPMQSFYSGVKVPLLLIVSSAVCMANFCVVNTVLGLRDDLAAACRGVVASQATVAICLASLAPLTALTSVSSDNYRLAVVMNGVFFAVATVAGQVTLEKHYRPLIAKNPLHRLGQLTWVTLYVFVAIQAAWVLRPFIGAPGLPPSFLRDDLWSNAYVVVLDTVWELLTGR